VVLKVAGITLASVALVVGGVLHLRQTSDLASSQTTNAAAPSSDAISSDAISSDAAPSLEIALEERPALSTSEDPSAPVVGSASKSSTAAHGSASALASAREEDHLSEEVALLARAQRALRSGHLDHALLWLGEHEHRFRRGVLSEERIAAKIQVFCALGREAEADALLARLSPKSVHGETSPHACGRTLRGTRKGASKGSTAPKGATPQGK
jgi:hypothetical protein